MKLPKFFPKFILPALLLLVSWSQGTHAQQTFDAKNTATAKGTAISAGGVQVSDISNNGLTIVFLDGDVTPVIFPLVGLSKTVAAPQLQANGSYNITYTLFVKNYSTIALNNIQITDDLAQAFPLPATFSMVGSPVVIAGNSQNGTGSIATNPAFNGTSNKNLLLAASSSIAGVPASGTATDYYASIRFTINVQVNGAYTTYNNTATVTATTVTAQPGTISDVSHNNASPNQNDASHSPLFYNNPTPVTLDVSDIEVNKTVNINTPAVNSDVIFTVKAKNNGPGVASPVVVTDLLPAGYTYVSHTAASGTSYTPATGIWALGTLNVGNGSEKTLTITARVLANKTAAQYINTASSNHVGDPVPGNNSSSVSTVSPTALADLAITNTDGVATYTPGTNGTYTVTVRNNGPSDVTGATVANALPPGVSTSTWTAVFTGGATGTSSGTGAINELVNMPTGSTIVYTVTMAIPSSLTGNLVSTATVATPADVTDTNLSNNTATDTDTQSSVADLAVNKTVNNPAPQFNDNITFTINTVNNGPSDASGVTVSDVLRAGYTFVSASPSVGTFNSATGAWTIGNLAKSASASMTIVAKVNPGSNNANYINTATLSGNETDPVPPNNTSTITVLPVQLIDLAISQVISTTTPDAGSNVTFTLTVLNNGPSNGTGVSVADLLKAGYTFVSASPSIGTYNATSGTWTIGNLAAGASVNMVITARVNGNAIASDYINTAVVSGSQTETTLANNTATVIAVPMPAADLRIVKTVSKNNPSINTSITFTLTASNIGPSNATGVTATDILKLGYTFVSASPSTGTFNSSTGLWTIGNLSTGSSATLTMTVVVKASGAYDNTATITGVEKDPVLSNNTSTVTPAVKALPVAVNNSVQTNMNVPVLIDILANDLKAEFDLNPSTVVIITQPLHGTLSVDPLTGKVTYTPNLNYVGTDTFTYTVTDVNGGTSNIATVDISIIDKPIIGLAKVVASYVKAVNGSYNVTYRFTVGNYGEGQLFNLSIKDDLLQTFKTDVFKVLSIKTVGSLAVNTAFNGTTVTEMLQTGQSLIKGQIEQFELMVNISLGADQVSYLNRAIAEGASIHGLKTTDQSTDGVKPDADNAGDISPNVPTPLVLARPKEFIPGGFSPNNDGINDNFVIENNGFKRISLEIFNRWGNRVYRSNDYKNDWKGKCNEGIHIGEDLPEGTYFYTVVLDGKDKYVGYITLNR